MNTNEPYAEFVDLGTNRLMVFANQFEHDGTLSWSIGTTSGQNVGVQIGSNDQQSFEQLKQLKKAVDGAYKFLNDKQQKSHGTKGKNDDGVKN
jgi:hypothetical protein